MLVCMMNMFDVCTYDHRYLTLMHVCVMHVKNENERTNGTNGKLNSRSRIIKSFIYFHKLIFNCVYMDRDKTATISHSSFPVFKAVLYFSFILTFTFTVVLKSRGADKVQKAFDPMLS